MQIPPQQIFEHAEKLLRFGECDSFELRSSSGTLRGAISANDALWLAHNLRIEAIVTKGGSLRHFRELPDDVVAALVEQRLLAESSDDITTGSSTFFAQTNQGAFKEHLLEAYVEDDYGFRRVVGEGGAHGFCYSLRGVNLEKRRKAA
jgi:hypothetical protein